MVEFLKFLYKKWYFLKSDLNIHQIAPFFKKFSEIEHAPEPP